MYTHARSLYIIYTDCVRECTYGLPMVASFLNGLLYFMFMKKLSNELKIFILPNQNKEQTRSIDVIILNLC